MKFVRKTGIVVLAVMVLTLVSCVTKPKGDLEQGRRYARDAERDMQKNFNN
jgi:hypothetical protein